MRKVLAALAATFSAIALVIGLKAQAAGAPRAALTAQPARGDAVRPTPSGPPRTSTATPGGRGTTSPPATGGYTGSAVPTPYGTTQVRAVLRDGRLTDVVVLRQTDGARSGQIDSFALPLLTHEAVAKQSADIDVVSGATYTSESYARSLQSALDAAGR